MSEAGVATPRLAFDWYQSTFRDERYAVKPEELVDVLAYDLGAGSIETVRGLNGYREQAVMRLPDGDVCGRLMYGGRNSWPNGFGSGDAAPAFARVVRSRFPKTHMVTRADIAFDVQAPGAFDLLYGECLAVADERGLSVSQAGDWHRGEAGRTGYIGSRDSEVRVRVYEKGLEQRVKAPSPEAAESVPKDWTRLELVVRPQKAPRRLLAASTAPEDFFGYSIWTQMLATRLWALDVPRVERASWKVSDDDEVLKWAVRQYGALLARQAERVGSWEALGLRLGRMIERRADL